MATLLSPRRFTPSLRHLTPSRSKIRARDLSFPFRVTTRSLTQLASSSMSQSTTDSEPNPQNEEKKAGNSDEVLVQYVVLRRDLIDTWPMGSVVTQGCHASVSAIWSHKEDPHTLQYCSPENIDSMHKVISFLIFLHGFFFSFLIFHKFLNLEMVEKDECHDGLCIIQS